MELNIRKEEIYFKSMGEVKQNSDTELEYPDE